MRALRLTPGEVANSESSQLAGSVLVASLHVLGQHLAKGTRVDEQLGRSLIAAAANGQLTTELRLVWPDSDDMHEDEAAEKLALAVGGAGVDQRPPRLSLLQLASKWAGVVHVRHEALTRLNQIEAIEVFTLFHGQCVEEGDVVAAVKVVPHVVPAEVIRRAIRLARQEGPLVEVRPYQAMHVAAIVCEPLSPAGRERFEQVADTKLRSLGATFAGVIDAWDPEPAVATERIALALRALADEARHQVVLVTGVSAGDPLTPFGDAMTTLGGRFVRRGLPVHPGSMLWLAELGPIRLLGLPGCGMFSMATAADLVLPRLITGEVLDEASLAGLAHGGVLNRDMRFRMPKYARDLETPDHPPDASGRRTCELTRTLLPPAALASSGTLT